MSFSNTSTGSKPADPYTKENAEEVSLDTKIEDLVAFIKKCYFGMMTTRVADNGKLVSRCMALAATVSDSTLPKVLPQSNAPLPRIPEASTPSSTPTQSLARRTIFRVIAM